MSSLKDLGPDLQGSGGLLKDERWQLALRVAASEEFRRSARLRDFLLFICRKTLQEPPEEVHEQYIGCAVFGRRADYNPGDDNIVRAEARELRRRLEQHFAGTGNNEPLEIRIPKGSYVPLFEARNQKPRETVLPSQLQTSATADKPVTGGNIAFPPDVVHSTDRSLTYLLLGILLVAVTFGVWQWAANHKLQTTLVDATGRGLTAQSLLWSRLFDSTHETYIVAADAGWCLLQRRVGREFSLDDYVSRRFVNSVNTRELRQITDSEYSSVADIMVIPALLHATAPFQTPTRVRYARDVSIEDFRSNNFIILGSKCSDPWGELFDPLRNFREDHDFTSDIICYVNEKPLPGESARYCNQVGPGGLLQAYCLISFVPNLSRSGNGLIIGGTCAEGTRAGGEFLTSADLDSKLREYLKPGSQETNLRYFELLLKTSGVPHGPLRAEYVTHRILKVGNN
jgi:hypothetical protein